MIKAHKLNKHIKRVSRDKYANCDEKLLKIDKILSYIAIAFFILAPLLIMLDELKGIDSFVIIMYTFIFIIFTYRYTAISSKKVPKTLLLDQYKVSYISWKLYKLLKVIIFFFAVAGTLYLLDYFDIVNVYVEYYEDEATISYLFGPLQLLVYFTIINIADMFAYFFKEHNSSIGYVIISFFIPAGVIFAIYEGVSGVTYEEVVYDDALPALYRNVSSFSFIDGDSLETLISLSVLVLILVGASHVSRKAARRRAYE